MSKKILYVSGSVGLGHVFRDITIAKELRKMESNLEISWLAANPASLVLRDAGEILLPELELLANDSILAEKTAIDFQLNLLKYLFKARKEWAHNTAIFKQVINKYQFDLVVGVETYEILVAMFRKKITIEIPFVMIYDFLGLDSMTKNPIEKIMVYFWNFIWAQDYKIIDDKKNLGLIIGELENVQYKKFGPLLPNCKEYAKKHYEFVGYIVPFEPSEYADIGNIRAKLGYGKEPLVVCSIGGTSIGKEVLELCGKSYPIIKKKFPVKKKSFNVPRQDQYFIRHCNGC
jgi:hypothetical protein